MLDIRKGIDSIKNIFNPSHDKGSTTSNSPNIPTNKQLLTRVKEICTFVKNQMEDSSFLGRGELKEQYGSLLKEVIGSYKNPNNCIISYICNQSDRSSVEIIEYLSSLLIPKGTANLIQFALESRNDLSTKYYFPVEALPEHTQALIRNSAYEYLSDVFRLLSIPLIDQINSIKNTGQLLLNTWEYFLFTFFSKISRNGNKNDSFLLTMSNSKLAPDLQNSDFLIEQIISNFDLFLFSKYFLFLFEVAKYDDSHDLHLFTNLIIEYFLNPITLVNSVNTAIERLEEEYKKSLYMGVQGSKSEFFTKTKMIPLVMTNELEPSQLMFLHATVIIVKDQWKTYLRQMVEDKHYSAEDCITVKLFRNMYRWFKILLTEKPMFVQNKLYCIGLIYLSIITPDDIELNTVFDQFISYEIDFNSKKSTNKSIFFDSFGIGHSAKAYSSQSANHLYLEKTSSSGRMDHDSFNSWLKCFIVFYTDTFRDFICYMAEDCSRSLLDYIFIFDLAELFKENGGMILKGWIELKNLSDISQGYGRNSQDIITFIELMGATREWVDPFSHDFYFNK